MPRVREIEKAERLNRARDLLRHVDQLPDAVEQLAQDFSISPRQAYRYLEQAQRLRDEIPPAEDQWILYAFFTKSTVRFTGTVARICVGGSAQHPGFRSAAKRALRYHLRPDT